MAKNILIFSDGTGQVGGLRPDQKLSNIYKMYRAMRPGTDSFISPAEQVAFYDAGLGTDERGGWRGRIGNFLAGAFGNGIGENIVDCYAAILKHYQPGDRIYLFGFSRGAYTARCVANVLNLCGVPSRLADGSPLPRLGPTLRRLAEEAVYKVYEHGSGKDRAKYEDQREALAARFRATYGSEGVGLDNEPQGNVAPTFIGVFDTVAALGAVLVRRVMLAGFFATLALTALLYWAWAPLALLGLIPIGTLAWALIQAVRRQFKTIWYPPEGGLFSWHFAVWNLKHYDRYLDTSVGFARHALSIDEYRVRFPRVPWGRPKDVKRMDDKRPRWIEQVWFAGNHSDIGGSHPEDESRLSDIALGWMLDELRAIPERPLIDDAKLRLAPDPLGLQHDEVRASRDAWPLGFHWNEQFRDIHPEASLHASVLTRLGAAMVPGYGRVAPYRPEALRAHQDVAHLYDGVPVATKVPDMRPITLLAALIFLLLALAHAARLWLGVEIQVGGSAVPFWPTWIAGALSLLFAVLLWREARR